MAERGEHKLERPAGAKQDESEPVGGRWRTVMEVLRLATGYLASHGVPQARLDAEVLLADVLATDRLGLYVQHDRPLTPEELARYRRAVAMRARRMPVAYILGRREFFGLSLAVDRRVLIPRPETELLVEAVLEVLRTRHGPTAPLLLADIGTGSGAIALALASQLPAATVYATDVDPGALEVAAANAQRLGLADRVHLCKGDLLAALPADLQGQLHALCCNPPYVGADELAELAPEVREWEPRRALTPGRDPLLFYRRLAAGARPFLRSDGLLALEVGAGQGAEVAHLFAGWPGWRAEVRRDLAGHDRVVLVHPAS